MTDLFYEIPGNPIPKKASGGYFTARDGVRLRYGLFAAVARPLKGTVILLAGRNECIEKYFETARKLSERGFATAILDWRGQGGSGRLLRDPQRGHVNSFAIMCAISTSSSRKWCCPTAAAPIISWRIRPAR